MKGHSRKESHLLKHALLKYRRQNSLSKTLLVVKWITHQESVRFECTVKRGDSTGQYVCTWV